MMQSITPLFFVVRVARSRQAEAPRPMSGVQTPKSVVWKGCFPTQCASAVCFSAAMVFPVRVSPCVLRSSPSPHVPLRCVFPVRWFSRRACKRGVVIPMREHRLRSRRQAEEHRRGRRQAEQHRRGSGTPASVITPACPHRRRGWRQWGPRGECAPF